MESLFNLYYQFILNSWIVFSRRKKNYQTIVKIFSHSHHICTEKIWPKLCFAYTFLVPKRNPTKTIMFYFNFFRDNIIWHFFVFFFVSKIFLHNFFVRVRNVLYNEFVILFWKNTNFCSREIARIIFEFEWKINGIISIGFLRSPTATFFSPETYILICIITRLKKKSLDAMRVRSNLSYWPSPVRKRRCGSRGATDHYGIVWIEKYKTIISLENSFSFFSSLNLKKNTLLYISYNILIISKKLLFWEILISILLKI